MTVLGKTKTTGYQAGIRKTFSVSPEKAWSFLFSDMGLDIWLGPILIRDLKINETVRINNKLEVTLTTLKVLSHIRMKYRFLNWENESVLQVRIIPVGDKTTISFHQEKLTGTLQRQNMTTYWERKLDMISHILR